MMRALNLLPSVGLRHRPLDLFDRFFDDWSRPLISKDLYSNWLPAADIKESETHYAVTVEVPGIDMKELDISYTDHVLSIKGSKTVESGENECAYCTERFTGSFERRFQIPGRVDEEKIVATYKDGVLKIELPKDEKNLVKKIEVH
jgi:HSP20 family protein